MTNKIAILHNLSKDTYHPIIFYPAPKPSEYDDHICRHFSMAHHTLGFLSLAEAQMDAVRSAAEMDARAKIDDVILWDGLGSAQTTYYFERG